MPLIIFSYNNILMPLQAVNRKALHNLLTLDYFPKVRVEMGDEKYKRSQKSQITNRVIYAGSGRGCAN
jgi:hypothetical protein